MVVRRFSFSVLVLALLTAGCVYTTERATEPIASKTDPVSAAEGEVLFLRDEPGTHGISFENNDPFRLGSSHKPYGDLRQNTYSEIGADFNPDISTADGESLVFASTRHNKNPDIYIKAANGTRIIQKTTSSASDIQPSFSPDGRFIAFASNRNGNWDIFITSANKEGPIRQVTRSQSDEITPSWSSDGSKIVFSAKGRNDIWEMWIINLKTRSLTNIGPGLFPDWHPTKEIIVFQRPRGRSGKWFSIWTVDASGNNLTEIVPNTNWAAINPSWSPDGEKIAFATVHKSPHTQATHRIQEADDVWLVNADGTNLTQLTVSQDPDWNPRWGPDGRIYFTTTRNGKKNIWSLKPEVFDLNLFSDPEEAQTEDDEFGTD